MVLKKHNQLCQFQLENASHIFHHCRVQQALSAEVFKSLTVILLQESNARNWGSLEVLDFPPLPRAHPLLLENPFKQEEALQRVQLVLQKGKPWASSGHQPRSLS